MKACQKRSEMWSKVMTLLEKIPTVTQYKLKCLTGSCRYEVKTDFYDDVLPTVKLSCITYTIILTDSVF